MPPPKLFFPAGFAPGYVEATGCHNGLEVIGSVQRVVYEKPRGGIDGFLSECLDDIERYLPGLRQEASEAYTYHNISNSIESQTAIFARELPTIPPEDISLFEWLMYEYLSRYLAPHPRISLQQAIELMTRTDSSPGWPYPQLGCMERIDVLEKGFRGVGADLLVEQYIAAAKEGYKAIWSLCEKVEVLKRKKHDEKRARLFVCCPIHYQLAYLQYYGMFHHDFEQACREGKFACFVGLSKFNGCWHGMFSRYVGKRVFSIDETNYDANISGELLRAVYRVKGKFAPNAPQFLVDEIVDTVMVDYKGRLLVKHQGNCSGQPGTCIDNSMIMIGLYLIQSYRNIGREFSFAQFDRVPLMTMGDDNICSEEYGITKEGTLALMERWGWIAKLESETLGPCGSVFLSATCVSVSRGDLTVYVPIPKRVRSFAHLLYSSHVYQPALTTMKLSAALLDSAWDVEYAKYLQVLIDRIKTSMLMKLNTNSTEDVNRITALNSIHTLETCRRMYLPFEDDAALINQHYKREVVLQSAIMPRNAKPKQTKRVVTERKTQRGRNAGTAKFGGKQLPTSQFTVRSKRPRYHIETARELVSNLNLPGPIAAGTSLLALPVSVRNNIFQRLSAIAQLYERHQWLSVRLIFTRAGSFTNSGEVVCCYDADPAYIWPGDAGTNVLSRAFMLPNVRFGVCGDPVVFNVPVSKRPLYNHSPMSSDISDGRLERLGNLQMFCVTALANGFMGTVEIEYTVKFMVPAATVASSSAAEGQQEEGYRSKSSEFSMPTTGSPDWLAAMADPLKETVKKYSRHAAEQVASTVFTTLRAYMTSAATEMKGATDSRLCAKRSGNDVVTYLAVPQGFWEISFQTVSNTLGLSIYSTTEEAVDQNLLCTWELLDAGSHLDVTISSSGPSSIVTTATTTNELTVPSAMNFRCYVNNPSSETVYVRPKSSYTVPYVGTWTTVVEDLVTYELRMIRFGDRPFENWVDRTFESAPSSDVDARRLALLQKYKNRPKDDSILITRRGSLQPSASCAASCAPQLSARLKK